MTRKGRPGSSVRSDSGGAWIWLYFLGLGALAGLVKVLAWSGKIAGHNLVAAGAVTGGTAGFIVLVWVLIRLSGGRADLGENHADHYPHEHRQRHQRDHGRQVHADLVTVRYRQLRLLHLGQVQRQVRQVCPGRGR